MRAVLIALRRIRLRRRVVFEMSKCNYKEQVDNRQLGQIHLPADATYLPACVRCFNDILLCIVIIVSLLYRSLYVRIMQQCDIGKTGLARVALGGKELPCHGS